jgi:hypothetical protein
LPQDSAVAGAGRARHFPGGEGLILVSFFLAPPASEVCAWTMLIKCLMICYNGVLGGWSVLLLDRF